MSFIETEFYEIKEVNEKEKFWGGFVHLSAIMSFPFSFFGILFPFFIWVIKREASDFLEKQGKEALNLSFNIVILNFISIYVFRSFISGIFIFLLFSLSLYHIIIAYKLSKKGLVYKYPYIFRLIKK